MKVLNDNEALNWCKGWPLQLDFDEDKSLNVKWNGPSYDVDLSGIPWRDLTAIARSLTFLGTSSLQGFSGGLIWIRRMGIASPDWEVVILRALERFRAGFGEMRSVETARAHLFRADESSECSAALLLVFLAEWDAYFVHPSGDWVAFVSNDEHITVTAKNLTVGDGIHASLNAWGPAVEETVPPRIF